MTDSVESHNLKDGCPRCHKAPQFCVCSLIVPFDNRISVLILQHPREAKEPLNSAGLISAALTNSRLRVGLSWPNLRKAFGADVDPKSWAVLYLGTKKESRPHLNPNSPITLLSNKNTPLRIGDLNCTGLIAIDGTWRQSKTIWWRNPWLLRLNRIVVNPSRRSAYGNLRREPRAESVSTIEAVAECLKFFESRPEIETVLMAPFLELLKRQQNFHSKTQ